MSKVTPLGEFDDEANKANSNREAQGAPQLLHAPLNHYDGDDIDIDEEYDDDEHEGGAQLMSMKRKPGTLGIGSALSKGMAVGGLATQGATSLGGFGASLTKSLADKTGATAGVNATLHLTNSALDKTGVKKGLNAVASATGANTALEVAKQAAEVARQQALAAASGALGGTGGLSGAHEAMKKIKCSARHSSAKAFANSSQDGKLRSPYPLPDLRDDKMDVVEFASVEYLCYEGTKEVAVTVCRRGPCKHPITLSYKNTNVNFSKHIFIPVEGNVTLDVDERSKPFMIQCPDDLDYNVEFLMDFHLTIEGESSFAVLGDLRSCRVVVLNDDTFPNKVKDMGDDQKVVMGFIVHNYHQFRRDVHLALFWKLVPGLCFVVNQFILQQTIRTITRAYDLRSAGSDTQTERDFIMFLGICYFVNFLLEYKGDIEFQKLKLGGKAARALRVACMDTAIQLTPAFEETFDVGRIMKTSEVAVQNAVENTWNGCFRLWASLVKLGLMVMFIVFTATDQAQKTGSSDVLFIIAVPFLMIFLDAILLRLNIAEASHRDLSAMSADDEWSSFMVQSSFLRQVITTFRKGFVVTKTFEDIHSNFNKVSYEAKMYTVGTQWGADAITTAMTAVVLVLTGFAVERGQLTVGAFVVFNSTINSFAPTLGSVIFEIFSIGKGYANILKVSQLLNADTRRKQLHRGNMRRDMLMAKYKARLPSGEFFDEDAFFMHDVTFRFNKNEVSKLPPLSCNIEGGQTVALKGQGSMGKKIVLRLMARHFIPTTGFIYFPTRWWYRFVDGNPNFFGGDMAKLQLAAMQSEEAFGEAQRSSMGTLEYNLKFGAQFKHPDPAAWDMEIYQLLKLLGVSEDLIGKNAEEFCLGPQAMKYTIIGLNGERMSMTNRALLSVARALLSSVDLLLISNMLDLLGPTQARNVFILLSEFCKDRALSVLATEAATTPMHLRKKKTVIFSTKLSELENLADNWMFIGGKSSDPPSPQRDEDEVARSAAASQLAEQLAVAEEAAAIAEQQYAAAQMAMRP